VAPKLGHSDGVNRPATPLGLTRTGQEDGTTPACILVVDDEAPVRTMIGATLEREGFRVQLASSGGQALAMLQQLGDQGRFEDAAVNFAITFEESPPSWDPPEPSQSLTDTQDMQKVEDPLPIVDVSTDMDAFVMDGIVAGPQPEVLRKLADYASERALVEVNCTELRRLEFVSAGSLFNQIAQFQAQGKRTILRHPNEMVAALLVVMGVDQISKIIHKKF